jgi:hypothetical protein
VEVTVAALAATAGLDEDRARLYEDAVLSCMSEATRRVLEERMASGNYEVQSDFLRKYIAQGRVEGEAQGRAEGEAKARAVNVLTVLDARGLSVPDDVRHRVLASSDPAELEHWLRRAAVVGSAREIFESTP